KYSLILHPGADISLVKMKFTDANKVSVADNGDLHIRTGFGDIIDHAPATFYANNHSSVINSKFVKSGSTVSFQLDGYNNTQEVVVDPWTQTPTISNSNGVWECEKDGAGNVYIIGGDSPMKLLKYNSTGVLQWTYNTTWDTANYWLGTFATDLAGNSYVTAGSIARLQKVTTAAAMLYNVAGGSMDEYWNIAFNCDQTKLIIGGTRLVLGSGLSPVGNGVIFDINTNTGAVNSLQVVGKNRPGFLGIHDPEEVRSITASHNARYYFLTLDSIGAIDQNFNACSSSSANVLFNFNHTYAFGYKSEDWRPKGNGGIMSVRANKNFVYTQNGKTISKRSLMTGAIITTVNIPGGISTANLGTNQPGNSGIDIDSCGNVYVGSGNAVIKYDASLNLLSSTAVPFHVYDVAVSYGGNVIACGATGTSTTVSRTGSVQSINMGACDPSVLTCCDANVCNAGPFCISDPSYTLTPATAGGIWSGTGVNASGVFSPSTAGVGVHPIVYTLPCGSDSLFITVSACAALNVCINNGTLTVSGGTPTYTWSTQSTVTSCTACVIGCNFPPGCSTTVTSWTPAATGTTTFTPGSYPVLVQDGAGASYTITTAGSVPNCTVACVAPTLSVSAQTNVSCFGGTNGSATVVASPAGTYTYTWQNGNLNGASQSSLSAGIYTVTATNGGCSGTTTVNITQPAVLSAGAVQTSSVTCHGLSNGTASVSISGGTSTYTATWSGGGSGTSIGGLSAGVHTVTVTDAHNCVATSTVNITQPVDLVITPTATVAASCGSSNGSATVTASGGTGALTYSWSTGATGQVLSGVPGGTYTVTVTDANNCTNSAGIVITSAGGPTATASSASITCNGLSNGTASVNISGGTPNYTVTWSSGGSGTSVSGLPAGTYTATITDANNCVTTTTVSVVQPLPISITFTNNSPSACGASTGSVTANASGGTGVITYTWNTGASGQTLSNVPAGSYTVTATDANNCSHIASVNIVTVNGPTVTPVATASVNCNGASTGSASVNISGGTPSYTVSWSNGGSGTTVNGLPAGTYTVIVTDASSCVSNGTITISQPPAVTVTVNSSPTGCLGSTGTATASATGGTGVLTYSWSNSQTGTTASGLGQGVYTVTVTDANSCITTHTVQVGVTNPPVVAIDSSHNVKCNGQTNGSAYVSSTGGTPGYTYTWSNAQTGTVATNLGQGTYTVIVTDAGGCKDTATITINQPQPLKDTIVNIQPENCNHQNGGASVSVTGGTAPFTIQWSSGQTTSTVSNFPAGTYTVLVTDSKGCTATNSVTITSVPGPTLTLVGQSDVTCNGLSNGTATVIATGGTPNYTYNWSNGSTGAAVGGLSSGGYVVTVSDAASCTYTLGLVINQPGAININTTTTPVNCNGGHNGSATAAVSGGTSPYTVSWSNGQSGNVITNLSAGVYTVSVIDNHNCPKSTTIIITENPPVDTLSITGAICLNDPNVLLTAPHGGIAPDTIGSPYQWNLSNNPIPGANTYTYNGNTSAVNNYSVNWFYHGCRYVSTNVLVTVSQDFGMLPQTNVFTPNDDKINDEFLPFSLSALGGSSSHNTQLLASMIDDYELVIYDRWGVLLFKTTTVTDTWNGKTPDGKDVSAGTYYWIARYKAKCSKNPGEQNIKGFVQLIR
ncbi:MAG TPA: gliding motility-associated C-terminal domain-containing protein, partial [Bacteroidia bacterium]|nr:gliding motility-associated C-terminal domain-containing protein [Bacteroidia bacterium]